MVDCPRVGGENVHFGAFESCFLFQSFEHNMIQVDVISRMTLSSHLWPLEFQPELKHTFVKKLQLSPQRQKSPQTSLGAARA